MQQLLSHSITHAVMAIALADQATYKIQLGYGLLKAVGDWVLIETIRPPASIHRG